MKQRFSTLRLISLSLILITFFFPHYTNTWSIILFFVITLFSKDVRSEIFTIFYSAKSLHLFALLFLIQLIGLLYSENIPSALSILERSACLIIFPYLFGTLSHISAKETHFLRNIFIYSAALSGLYCILIGTIYYLENGTVYNIGQAGHFSYNHFMHHRLTKPIDQHAIYYSFYISFVNIIILNTLVTESISIKHKVLYSFCFVFNLILLYLLKSSNFNFIFPAICLLNVLYLFRFKILSSRTFKIGGVVLTILVLAVSYTGVKSKVENFSLSYNLSDDHFSPITRRFAKWECTWDILKDNIILGVGTGDGDDELMSSYKRNNFYIGLEGTFNVHNMYLQYWLNNGIIGLILFLSILTTLLYRYAKARNIIAISFCLMFASFSLTESTMLNNKGVVFFTFFACIFYWLPNFWTRTATNENSSSS